MNASRISQFLVFLVFSTFCDYTFAAGRVEFRLGTEVSGASTITRKWYEILTKIGVDGLQINSKYTREKIRVEESGTKDRPTYIVYGRITQRGELFIKDAIYKTSQKDTIKAWVEELKTYGLQGSPEGKPLFGLKRYTVCCS